MISVVIPTVDRVALLDEALRSLVRQTFEDFEVLVVNDGGPPLAPVAAEWHRELRLRVIELSDRSGVSRARNVGIEHARGSHIAFLDDDDVFLPHHLQRAHDALEKTGADLVYLGALVSDCRLETLPADTTGMYRKAYAFDEWFLLVANYIHTGSVVVRNFAATPVRFDETLSHCEDWDLWIALRWQLGYRVTFVEETTSVYHQLPDATGLVSEGQAVSPSPFSIVRDRIYAKWPCADPRVEAYRRWFTAFETQRNARISRGRPLPPQLFDRVLARLYTGFAAGAAPDVSSVASFFED